MLIYEAGGNPEEAACASAFGTRWRLVSDQVMGGRSSGTLTGTVADGRRCLHLAGDVRLDNDGGFLQMALDLDAAGDTIDVSRFAGIELTVLGNRERYSVHLRTGDVRRPWQSYRAAFDAPARWHTVYLPFTDFVAHRIEQPLDLSRVRRIGLVAIGRAFQASLCVARIDFRSRTASAA